MTAFGEALRMPAAPGISGFDHGGVSQLGEHGVIEMSGRPGINAVTTTMPTSPMTSVEQVV